MAAPLNLADFNSFTALQQSQWILSFQEFINQREGTVAHAGSNILVKFGRNADGTVNVISAQKLNNNLA